MSLWHRNSSSIYLAPLLIEWQFESGHDVDGRIEIQESQAPSQIATLFESAKKESQRRQATLDQVAISLSSELVKIFILPWQEKLMTGKQLQAYVNYYFQERFGLGGSEWEFRVFRQGYGLPALACALSKSILKEVALNAKAQGLTISRIEPYFATVLNRVGQLVEQLPCWVVIEEDDGLSALYQTAEQGYVHFAHWKKTDQSLTDLIDRETKLFLLSQADSPIYLYSRSGIVNASNQSANKQIIRLQQRSTAISTSKFKNRWIPSRRTV